MDRNQRCSYSYSAFRYWALGTSILIHSPGPRKRKAGAWAMTFLVFWYLYCPEIAPYSDQQCLLEYPEETTLTHSMLLLRTVADRHSTSSVLWINEWIKGRWTGTMPACVCEVLCDNMFMPVWAWEHAWTCLLCGSLLWDMLKAYEIIPLPIKELKQKFNLTKDGQAGKLSRRVFWEMIARQSAVSGCYWRTSY